jgi:hypothetical protein
MEGVAKASLTVPLNDYKVLIRKLRLWVLPLNNDKVLIRKLRLWVFWGGMGEKFIWDLHHLDKMESLFHDLRCVTFYSTNPG